MIVTYFGIICASLVLGRAHAWSAPKLHHHRLLRKATAVVAVVLGLQQTALADDDNKLRMLPDVEFLDIVSRDISDRQALATADFTRSIYSEDCTFQDEIDTYKINEYVKGTKALFDGTRSRVELTTVPEFVDPNRRQIEYRFKETLAFKVPLNPKVDLTGKVRLVRDPEGLVISSREFWDASVAEVLERVYF